MDQQEPSAWESQRTRLVSPIRSSAESTTGCDDIDPGGISAQKTAYSSFETSPETKPTKRKYTPGLNSYLKVELEDSVVDRLHQAACEIQATVKNWAEPVVEAGDVTTPLGPDTISVTDKDHKNETEQDDQKTRTKKRPLMVKPRSRNSLHMTFFFGGETLCELPEDELVEWHQNVTNRLAESDFTPSSSSDINETTDALSTSLGSFRVRELCLFPPRRNNLVVAILEAPPEWHDLHDDIREIAQNGSSRGLRDITNRSKARWTPHITLCNVYGGTKAEMRQLTRHLAEMSFNSTEEEANRWAANARRIAMGGPVPQQIELDWNFTAR